MKIRWNIRPASQAFTIAATLFGGSLFWAAPVLAADALPVQLSTTTGSTLIRSLLVNNNGLSFTMGTGLFQSKTRFIVSVDGNYVGETYGGYAYYMENSNAAGVTTVTLRMPLAVGKRVDVAIADGEPGLTPSRSSPRVVASALSGELSDISLNANGGLNLTMSESVFRSTTRTIIWVDGQYTAEIYAGVAYYASNASANGVTTVTVATPIKPGQKIEVGVVPGQPGTAFSRANARMLATVNATTAPKLLIDQASSTLLLGARGNAQNDAVRENHVFRHNNTEPTGRFVKAGETIGVTLPNNSTDVEAVIGQYGVYAKLNGGNNSDPKRIRLSPGFNSIVSDRDGIVSLAKVSGEPEQVMVTGGKPIPTFVLGQTSVADFKTQLSLFADAPFAVVEAERVLAMFQRSTVTNNLSGLTDERVRSWDQVVNKTDEVFGLSLNGTGVNRKSPARILIANPDTGPGYASAYYERVTFQNDTGAGPYLISGPITDQWGLWHEVGHLYQQPHYEWYNMIDVTNNVSAIAIQLSLGVPSRLTDEYNKPAIATYLAKPDAERNYDREPNHLVKLGMLDGLRAKFGDSFYPTLNRLYRERAPSLSFSTDDAKQQYFMVTAGEVSRRNLSAYFKMWGMKPSAATEAALARYPAP